MSGFFTRTNVIFLIIIVLIIIIVSYLTSALIAVLISLLTIFIYKLWQNKKEMMKAQPKSAKVKTAEDLIREINAEASSREFGPEDDIHISEPLQYIMRTDAFTGGLEDGTITDVTLGYDNDMIRDANATGIFTDAAQNTMTPQQIRQQLLRDSPFLGGPLAPEGFASDPDKAASAADLVEGSEPTNDREVLHKYDNVYPLKYGPVPDYKPETVFDSDNYKTYIAGLNAAKNARLEYPKPTGGYGGGYEKKKKPDFSKDFWDTNVDLRSIQANMGGSGDNQIYNRMKYMGMQAKIAADIRASMNRYTFQPYYDEELRIKENQIWWENDALEEVF